jgi:putative MFS transporter
MLIWFTIAFVYYGTVICLPTIIKELDLDYGKAEDFDFFGMMFIVSTEFASYFIAAYFI